MTSAKEVLEKLNSKPEDMSVKAWCASQNPPLSYRYVKNVMYRQRRKEKANGKGATEESPNKDTTATDEATVGHPQVTGEPLPADDNGRQEDDEEKEATKEKDEFLGSLARTRVRFNKEYSSVSEKLKHLIKRVYDFDRSKLDLQKGELPFEFKHQAEFAAEVYGIGEACGHVIDLINELESKIRLPLLESSVPESSVSPFPHSPGPVTIVQMPTASPQQSQPSKSTLPPLSRIGSFFRGVVSPPPPSAILRDERVESVIETLKQLLPNLNRLMDFHQAACYRIQVVNNPERVWYDHNQIRKFLVKFDVQVSSGARAAVNHRIRQWIQAYTSYMRVKAQQPTLQTQQIRTPFAPDEMIRT